MANFDDEDIIKNYLDGMLDEETRRAVEDKIATDKAFAEEVNLERDIIEGLYFNEQDPMREAVRSFQEELETEGFFEAIFKEIKEGEPPQQKNGKTIKHGFLRRYWWLLLLVLIVILAYILSLFYYPQGEGWIESEEQGEVLEKNYFAPLPDRLSAQLVMEEKEQVAVEEQQIGDFATDSVAFSPIEDWTTLRKGMQHYKKKEYLKASQQLESYLKIYPNGTFEAEAELYIGISYLALADYNQASKALEKALACDSADDRADILWYLALSQLEIEAAKAEPLLRELQTDSVYGSLVLEILESKGMGIQQNEN